MRERVCGAMLGMWMCFAVAMATVRPASNTPSPIEADIDSTYGQEYWYAEAAETLKKRLQYTSGAQPIAKNIIMVVGDGMSLATTTAARALRGQRRARSGLRDDRLAWDEFPAVALTKTYNVDAQTGESSACATALLCGAKANYETVGLDARAKFNDCRSAYAARLTSLADWAHEAGKWSGVVTTTRVTHATPAALYARAPSRYWEDDARVPQASRRSCKDIALQLVDNEPGRSMRVILGGGRRHFLPRAARDPERTEAEGRRLDGRNLADDWLRDKRRRGLRAHYVWSKRQLAATDFQQTDALLGLFDYSHLPFTADQPPGEEADPSLADMTRAALGVLQQNKKGFFLLIEGGRIDHAHHRNDPYRALDETLELETAVLAALERVNPAETLVLVAADHAHVMTMGGHHTPRHNPILGTDTVVSDVDGLPYSTLLYGNGPGHSEPRGSNATVADTPHASAAPRLWATHGAEDVPVYALGPMATILFAGTVEQSYVAHAIAYAACLAHHAARCREPHNYTSPHVTKCIAPEVSSISAAGARPPEVVSGDASGRATSGRMVVASSVMADDVALRPVASSASVKLAINLLFGLFVFFGFTLR